MDWGKEENRGRGGGEWEEAATGGQGQRCGMGLGRTVEEENSWEKYNDRVVDATVKSITVCANAAT